ncbi:MAG: PHP domain-containing protein, partial [Lachnospiraceae bacterium]|nr:PHP domain-containing protein [Lachnospiraceae bacterium]
KEEKESFIEIETRRIVAEAMKSRPSAAGDDEILTLDTVAGGDAAAFENMIDENPDLAGGRMSTVQALGEGAAAVLTRREASQTAASSEGFSDRPASVFMTDKTGAAKNKADKDSAQGKQGKISEGSGDSRTSGSGKKTYSDGNGRWKGKGRKSYSGHDGDSSYKKDPDMIYGRPFDDLPINLAEIQSEIGQCCVQGQIQDIVYNTLKTGSVLCVFHIFDGTDTIGVKTFSTEERVGELKEGLSCGMYVKVKGAAIADSFEKEIVISSVRGIKKAQAPEKEKRMDHASRKRVELHCHTKFSELDAVSDVSELMKTVYDWDMPALAITDHGNVQAFTEAFHRIDKSKRLKLLYGMEGYLVDDLTSIVENPDERSLDDTFVVFDLETTGLNNNVHKIIEIGAVKVENGEIVDRYSVFVNPQEPISFEVEQLTSINDAMVADAKTIDVILPEFLEFCKGCALVGHNAAFDVNFVIRKARELGIELGDFCWLCTMRMARYFFPASRKATLDRVAKELDVELGHHHRAVDDAECTAHIFLKFS